MAEPNLDEDKIKQIFKIFKTALVEVIQENQEVFSDLFAENIEDIGL